MNACIAKQPPISNFAADLWNISDANFRINEVAIWTAILAAAENFAAAAEDIADARVVNGVEVDNNPWIERARDYLHYFHKSMRNFYETQTTRKEEEKEQKGKRIQETSNAERILSEDILKARTEASEALLNLNFFITALFDEPLDPVAIPASLPNHDIVELVVQAKYCSMTESERPTNLPALQITLESTQLFETCTGAGRKSSFGKHWSIGMPHMTFICLGHRDQLQVGCSKSKWPGFKNVTNALAGWRLERFADVQRKADILWAGNHVKRVFDAFRADDRMAGSDCESTIRSVWRTLHQLHQRKSREWAFDHKNEVGRAFYGQGLNIFQPTSRCWKCRFVHLYDVMQPPFQPGVLPADNATANIGLSCAEDLCHYFCSEIDETLRTKSAPEDEDVRFSLAAD